MATSQDLIKAALREIGVLAASETGSTDDMNDGLARLNRMLDRWAAEKMTIYTITRSLATLTANQSSFTVGTGGNVNIVRPVFVEKVNFVDTSQDPDAEYQIHRLTEGEYEAITLKALTSLYPEAWYYNPTYPTGTLYPWPIPTSSTLQWAVYHWAAVPAFASLATTVSLPPGYEDAIVQNLALLLCPSYGVQVNPILAKSAADSLGTLKRANARERLLTFGPETLAGRHGDFQRGYNIFQG